MKVACKPRRGTISNKSQAYACKRPTSKKSQSPNGGRNKEAGNKMGAPWKAWSTKWEISRRKWEAARTVYVPEFTLELVLRDAQTLMKGPEAPKTETKGERVQGVGF
ncbi:hypothetical protein K438DRAFT_1773052 [Mycena galopus ATCC 62051]|nr:hypothetical protein K438DRAFT_1773052 [Mycena galopus ATCC 62051]